VRWRYHDGVGAALAECVDVDAVLIDRDRRHLEVGLLDDQSLGVPARVLQRHAVQAAGAQPPTDER
jgi:hypothetical protein